MASFERLTPDNSAIVLVDYVMGFVNLFRSHTMQDHLNASLGLAKTAQAFNVPLVVTGGKDTDHSGPMYPELRAVLGDHPVIERRGQFDAFEDEEFRDAVAATGVTKLVLAGLMTEGCVLHTAMGALRHGYEPYVVTDATAGETAEGHAMALQRLFQVGVAPTTWLSLATEYQVSWERTETVEAYTNLILDHSPQLGMGFKSMAAQAAPQQRPTAA
ncbi:isochorismatase family protein [Nocardiopsis sp. MG754419]|uniref:isochorismatase family protein n=1 Tax=Nocardiopsis sp. MG754419 TaxID=2259865 RepID=UPI001BAA72B9|nr:isochorismatase family protein [Nocardiopsis sp. MG754419]MBR8741221.1 isochorismatase [Nocardiopsis sp. MG754419]